MTGKDLYNRDLFLSIKTSLAWNSLRLAAGLDGISLIAVSGFRSVERQQQIVEPKNQERRVYEHDSGRERGSRL
jgi:LAS superfamily LD-carboxypeptidase LdcB